MRLGGLLLAKLSLSARLLIPLLAVVGLLVGGYAMWSLRSFEHQLETEFQKRITFAERMASPPLKKALWDLFADGADEVLSGLSSLDGFVYGIVLDANGEEFATIGTNDLAETALDTTEVSLVWSDGTILGEFRFGVNRADLEHAIVAARRDAVFMAGSIFVLTALAIAWIAHGISRPIGELAGVISHLDSVELKIQHQDRGDTIGNLARGLVEFREILLERNVLQQNKAAAEIKSLQRAAKLEQERATNVAIEASMARDRRLRQQNEQLERNAAIEIAKVVSACARGDFSRRVLAEGKSGIFLEMGEGLNAVGEVAEEGLNGISAAIHALSEGNFVYRIDNKQHGIFEKISEAINHTAEILGTTIGTVVGAGQTVASSSSDIATSTADIAARTSGTVQTIMAIAASLTELTDLVDATAASTDRTNALVLGAVKDVAASETTLNQTRESIGAIKSSSAEIAKIIEVIEGIARQTNFLALNAGVEAARAGEHGKGFGVIASEVRALSLRSAQAAQDIAEIIDQNKEVIETGVQSVEDCVGALEVVSTSTGTIALEIEDVALASRNQSMRIGSIRIALQSLEKAMEETSAVCKATSASTRELDCQANDLNHLAASLAEPRNRSSSIEREHRNVA